MALSITIAEKKPHVFHVELAGDLNSDSYRELEDKLTPLITSETKALSLEMGGVDYISSIGIRVVISAKKRLKEQNAVFAMVNLQPQIKKIFDVMKLLPILEIFDEMPEADKYIDQIIQEEMGKDQP